MPLDLPSPSPKRDKVSARGRNRGRGVESEVPSLPSRHHHRARTGERGHYSFLSLPHKDKASGDKLHTHTHTHTKTHRTERKVFISSQTEKSYLSCSGHSKMTRFSHKAADNARQPFPLNGREHNATLLVKEELHVGGGLLQLLELEVTHTKVGVLAVVSSG